MKKLTLLIVSLIVASATTVLMAQEPAEAPMRWGRIEYKGEPWVKDISTPIRVTQGLDNRHISLWASHGRYFDQKKGEWQWQRPSLFATSEDLFTQTIVVPYLIPMLENAGAIVFTPRERDWQTEEVIVDNDGSKRNYIEVTNQDKWVTAPEPGFAYHEDVYHHSENPFIAGTARMAQTTGSNKRYSLATYQPDFAKAGRYAVYVSYQTLPNSIDDALYTVWHKGERTLFKVNQQMGGSTWVYLGTFDFDAGYSEFNRVTVSTQSDRKGVVTTDAVRFGGGMGNIERWGLTSGMPRALEGARYYAQWAGMPDSVYSSKNGQDDYADDINVRSLMTNLLGGGSCYMPNSVGRHVPIELSLAIHSDAGYRDDGNSTYGPLAICTTAFNDGKLDAGLSRETSRQLARQLLDNEKADISAKYGITWNRNDKPEFYDRNYSETRVPKVPSAILETMSHQNFPDMRYGQDPNFRFTLARSIYKTVLRYISNMHGTSYQVTPLAPRNFRIEFNGKHEVRLSWDPVSDPQEPKADPSDYIVYTAVGDADFDNGMLTHSKTHIDVSLEPGMLYHFKVAAVNKGGRSFTTEVLSALSTPKARKTILVVNGFQRLSSPAVRNTPAEQGFDLDADIGVTRGPTLGWMGRQINFDRSRIGILDAGLGDTGSELAGRLIAGNDFNYVMTHAEAIASAREYNIVSCSSEAFERQLVKPSRYDAVDLLLGLQCDDGHSLVLYKSFSTAMRASLSAYTAAGGALLVSGAYIGSDMQRSEEQQFLARVLKCQYGGQYAASMSMVTGLGMAFEYWNRPNASHYAATHSDVLMPVGSAYTVMQYPDGQDAAVAYKGSDYRSLVMGFPFECIVDRQKREAIMRGILNYLIK